MLAACETGEVFALLEARDALEHCAALYAAVREPWLTRALLRYHARTGSARAVELLARAPDAHARHLLDALLDQLRGERAPREHALAALAPLLARRPAWLHRLPAHPLARELLRAAARESAPLPLLHALLALAALLPAAPALAPPHWPELADALLRPAALPPPRSPHLPLAQRALFRALYAAHPAALLAALRHEAAAPPARAALRALAALLRRERLHPALLTGEPAPERGALAPPAAAPSPPVPPVAPPAGCGAGAARANAALRPGAEPWFALAERCGADSAPATPLPAEPAPDPEPEAAVEATPENTPAKEPRTAPRPAADSGAVRALGRKEASPPGAGDALAARLARVALERRAADSPVPMGGAPPVGAARPLPRREPLDGEDREVLELTEGAAEDAWPADDEPPPPVPDPRALERGRPPARGHAAPARRSASCSGEARGRGSCSVAVQTLDVWPAPYEFLIADFYSNFPAEEQSDEAGDDDDADDDDDSTRSAAPCARLDRYLAALYSGAPAPAAEPAEQLALLHAQLMFERWRREAHAERNRRLLGRCRQARALELQNATLRERLRAAAAERDELLRRLARPAPPAAVPAERELRLEAALAEEGAARLRAEAALRESEAARARDAAELRRSRGESWEAARHVEALARAALAAERRAEHVRRLRRELLVLAEREARLGGALRGAGGGMDAARAASEARALRAAAARAEAEAETARAAAEAAGARAHELEAALAAREAAVAELRRGARAAAEEAGARQRALQDKCAALARAVRAGEARRLERLAGAVAEHS
ncbi:hamartin isoform X2 [Maniola jurtina]|uniref:hamartin isoform X2 n=1 Tax=Maniola jurtina TaxID=191418 RepID=UPI001E685F7F|nr:hamartin isoform X2 [Maniola jurtina]